MDSTYDIPACRACGARKLHYMPSVQMCSNCYGRNKRFPGKPPRELVGIPVLNERQNENFDAKVDRSDSDGCWPWTGGLRGEGRRYGAFRVGQIVATAHRVALARTGQDVTGLEVDHLCRNTVCVRPDHLEAVTSSENIQRKHLRNGTAAVYRLTV